MQLYRLTRPTLPVFSAAFRSISWPNNYMPSFPTFNIAENTPRVDPPPQHLELFKGFCGGLVGFCTCSDLLFCLAWCEEPKLVVYSNPALRCCLPRSGPPPRPSYLQFIHSHIDNGAYLFNLSIYPPHVFLKPVCVSSIME